MKNYLLTLLTCLFMAAVANAEQILIYKTYQDYKNNTPTTIDGDIDGFPDSSPALVYKSGIRIKSNGKKEDYRCSDFWGFKFKDVLFRCFKFNLKYSKNGQTSYGFMALVSEGKICYWENGIAIIDILNSTKEKKKGNIEGLACDGKFGLSKSIDADIITARFNNFIKSNKEYATLASEFKTFALAHEDFPKVLKKENGIKNQDKLMDLGGTDDIAYLNLAAGVNNNAGKPMGISAGIYIQGMEMTYIRDFFKKYNNGNFNALIYNSEFE